ncbi:hypothetical protein PVK06_035402 [Gossypium arboreum]|uniref:RNase H type-1 domain-containing protein n=1 Tax=Gossypium arboreum TaxID=29729 RepID=A0ABR0NIZ0_GOSAR|nr:hypothetical protein PVK06_035402 [Gossypium arboreum]
MDRCKRNKVEELVDGEGNTHASNATLLWLATDYFTSLFTTKSVGDPSSILEGVEPCISQQMNEDLENDFTYEEVCSALKAMSPLKASGEDEIGMIFYQRMAATRGVVNGFRVSRQAPRITHLFFAADSLIIGDASINRAMVIKDILEVYVNCSGQKVNFDKLEIFFSSNVDQFEPFVEIWKRSWLNFDGKKSRKKKASLVFMEGAAETFSMEKADQIMSLPILTTDQSDKVVWFRENSGIYSAKSGYKMLLENSIWCESSTHAVGIVCLLRQLKFALDSGFTNVILKSDSRLVVNNIQQSSEDYSETRPFTWDVKNLARKFHFCQFQFIARERKGAAHAMAVEGMQTE